MIVDFQHHFTPRELIKEDPGDKLIVRFDAKARRATPSIRCCTTSTSTSR